MNELDEVGTVPVLNQLTLTNICREIDIHNGKKPSVHKANFEPGEMEALKKEGKWKKK